MRYVVNRPAVVGLTLLVVASLAAGGCGSSGGRGPLPGPVRPWAHELGDLRGDGNVEVHGIQSFACDVRGNRPAGRGAGRGPGDEAGQG